MTPEEKREHHRNYHAEWYQRNKAAERAKQRAYYHANRDRLAAASRAWQRANPERTADKRRAWAASNPERTRQFALADAHRRRGAKMDSAALEYGKIIGRDPCSYCGGPGREMDHITPVYRGGGGDWHNLTAACRSCNASKSSKSLLAFLLT